MFQNLFNINLRKTSVYYFFLVFFTVIFPIFHYPSIFGVDSFQVIWMANALRDGALFSNNTWLIHPTSYFGYYPFSHRAIFVPMVLALLINLFEIISSGFFGIAEAILALNIILILVVYKSSRNIAKTLFKEEWSRFVFVAAILLSQYLLNEVTMTVSTRLIITIIMLLFLDLNLKILNNSINKLKASFIFIIFLLVGLFSHRLWFGLIITIIFMILTIFIRKYENLQKLTIFLIIPLSLITFFVGLEIFGNDYLKYLGGSITAFIDEKSLLGMSILFGWFYFWQSGVIFIFFPLGVLIIIYKIAISLKNSNQREYLLSNNYKFVQKFYLILFIIPFSFLLPVTFYSIVLFFPILVIFSIYGLIYIKKVISKYSEILSWIFLSILLSISTIYSSLKIAVSIDINFLYIYIFLITSFSLFLLVLLINVYKSTNNSHFSFNLLKFKKGIWTVILVISISIFSITNIETKIANISGNPKPWNNLALTDEEIEIISFFQNVDVNGLIFTFDPYISLKISGVGFLPSFHGRTSIGQELWYQLIGPNEIHRNTVFSISLSSLINQDFFGFWPEYANFYFETSPLEVIKREIIKLDMTIEEDRNLIRFEYGVEYIITTFDNISHESNNWVLIDTLFQSDLEPIYLTDNLLVWRIE